MTITMTFYGHAALQLDVNGTKLLVDPFLSDNPLAPVTADEVEADYILISHGHSDHVGDTVAVAKRTGAQVIATVEVAGWISNQGVEKTHSQQIGGGFNHPFGYLKLTLALHGSAMPDGSYGGNPAGFLLEADGKRVYLACDTGLFGDMALIGEDGLDLAVLPIGDNYTMGPKDAVRAVQLLKPKRVVPIHYNTWPVIAQDVDKWAADVKALDMGVEVAIVQPGDTITV